MVRDSLVTGHLRKFAWIFIFAIAGCGASLSEPPAPTVDVTAPNHDVQALAQIIKLNPLPQQVSWVQYAQGQPSRAPGPTDYVLIAVLEYDEVPDFGSQLTQQTGSVTVNSGFMQTWFPMAVQEAFEDDPDTNILRLKVASYDATPYTSLNGYMFIVDNIVFISVFTT